MRFLAVITFLVCSFSFNSYAEIIRVEFIGYIDQVEYEANLVFSEGDSFSGYMIIDTEATDVEEHPERVSLEGIYFEFLVNGYTFTVAPFYYRPSMIEVRGEYRKRLIGEAWSGGNPETEFTGEFLGYEFNFMMLDFTYYRGEAGELDIPLFSEEFFYNLSQIRTSYFALDFDNLESGGYSFFVGKIVAMGLPSVSSSSSDVSEPKSLTLLLLFTTGLISARRLNKSRMN
ncbi:hypothetical protein [Thalassotalea sp. PS06]|uniref:hypothetical protein n=1 Tax=Thalassotalea sp. PS06 TaxID=2594005 RepID=UPI0011633CDD|nr:hypothetical protein [Thalassotalea sp. PS06]QDP01635.1 hypothetical protein FNC98_09985 [Thalassotalea sp. PS06]